MRKLNHISRHAARLHLAVTALMVILPLVVAVYFMRGLDDPGSLAAAFPALPARTTPDPQASFFAFALGALSLVPMLYSLAQIRALFALYSAGQILTEPCAERIGRAGAGLASLALLQTVLVPVQGLILTADVPSGRPSLIIAISSETRWLLLCGLLLAVIGRIMAEAARLAEENAGFV